jgi:hypothetical protein
MNISLIGGVRVIGGIRVIGGEASGRAADAQLGRWP